MTLEGIKWADLTDDPIDGSDTSVSLTASDNSLGASLGASDASMGAPMGVSESGYRDPSMGVISDTSMGTKRELDIGNPSWQTDDGFDDRPRGHNKRLKDNSFPAPLNVVDDSYKNPVSDAKVISLVEGLTSITTGSAPSDPMLGSGLVPAQISSMLAPAVASVATVGGMSTQVATASPPRSAVTDNKPKTAEETLEKRQHEIAMIRRDFPEDVVAQTPMGRAGNLDITKRPWEEAKAEYRSSLKIQQLKSQTTYSDETIKRALEVVHEDRMKANAHVELALDFLPRLEGLLQRLTDEGVSADMAMLIVKQTYRRTDQVMISAQDHLTAALAAKT